MSSTLQRLFRYAKATRAEARENFTTEALAAAIRAEPAPFIHALSSLALVRDAGAIAKVDTQVVVRGAGIVDLIVTWASGRSLWIEVKVDADESGQQLANYRAYLAALEEARRPDLIVLGPHALAADVPWLSWQRLRDAVRGSQIAHPYWIDFRIYLEDIGMADTYDEQVTDVETRVLVVSRNLVGKVARILARFTTTAGSDLTWPRDEQKITDAILNRWKDRGARAFTIAHNVSNHVGISAGAYHEPTTDDAWLGLWVWISPKRVKERQVVAAAVVAGGEWDSDWSEEPVEWQVWGAYRRLTDFADSAAASTWLAEKLRQLRERAVFDVVMKLG